MTADGSDPDDADLDAFAAAGARLLGIGLDAAWREAVRTHLRVGLRMGALVEGFPLPDEAEPAAVFAA